MPDFTDKTVLVTGASRGLGRAAALKLAGEGAHVLVHYNGRRDAAEAVAEEARSLGTRADVVGADLSAADGAHRLAADVRALGIDRLDALVANAGVAEMAPFAEQTMEAFDRQFAVNVRAPYFLIQQLLPALGTGSAVVLLSSLVARSAFDGASAYSATKGAVESLVYSLAHELGPRGIRVNAVAPGAIDTDMASGILGTEDAREAVKAIQVVKRIGQPDDIAEVVAFLASDRSRWVVGRVVEASGGANL